jgi:hypothetical protein
MEVWRVKEPPLFMPPEPCWPAAYAPAGGADAQGAGAGAAAHAVAGGVDPAEAEALALMHLMDDEDLNEMLSWFPDFLEAPHFPERQQAQQAQQQCTPAPLAPEVRGGASLGHAGCGAGQAWLAARPALLA